jgi:NADP-dependent 3-hydroxy acid dehydrogenase YdfG
MRAIVTGAGSGIGRATARLLAASPPDATPAGMVLVDRDASSVEAVAAELRNAGTHAGGVSPNRRKFRQTKSSPATIASRSMTCPPPRKV